MSTTVLIITWSSINWLNLRGIICCMPLSKPVLTHTCLNIISHITLATFHVIFHVFQDFSQCIKYKDAQHVQWYWCKFLISVGLQVMLDINPTKAVIRSTRPAISTPITVCNCPTSCTKLHVAVLDISNIVTRCQHFWVDWPEWVRRALCHITHVAQMT